MTLKEFLSLIQDEEARIELEIDECTSDEYKYDNFWLSDYRDCVSKANKYDNYSVYGFSITSNVISIYIK